MAHCKSKENILCKMYEYILNEKKNVNPIPWKYSQEKEQNKPFILLQGKLKMIKQT